jgi:RimJ/RimL family protein N-acetyltransferase
MAAETGAIAPRSMRLPESVQVVDTQEGNGVNLQPITDEQLASHLPLPDATLQYLPTGSAQNASDWRKEITGDNGQMWGIHPVVEGETSTSPVGVVAVDHQEGASVTATVLFHPEEHRGRGLGTAAKLGVMAVGYAGGVEMFGTSIAVDNAPSQRSAAKVGYVPIPESVRPDATTMPTGPEGTPAQWRDWMAFRPSDTDSDPPGTLVAQSGQAFGNANRRYEVVVPHRS